MPFKPVAGSEAKYFLPWLKALGLVLVLPVVLLYLALHWIFSLILIPKPLRWVWDDAANPGRKRLDLSIDKLKFPSDFLWGTATAAHQIEGDCDNNNWHRWEQMKKRPADGHPTVRRGMVSGKAADHWSRVKEDVKLMKELNVNSYRFSVEWSKIEPSEGEFDLKVLDHYSKEIDLLIQNGIEPMLTLHHFTQPIWFDDKGGWEKRENLDYFYRFAGKVYEEYCDRVRYWCTFNEPTVFSLVGWLEGSFPPGKRDAPLWDLIGDAVNVLSNLMLAHVVVYRQLKAIDSRPQIGIVHNIFNTHPYRRWHPIDYLAAYIADNLQNNLVLQFLRTGVFKFKFPILGKKGYFLKMPEACQSFDFIGINYYSHMFYKFSFSLENPIRAEAHPDDKFSGVMTDMEYPIYAEGFYQTIMRVSQALPDVPIYITENGVADDDDSRRKLFIKRYMYALSRAIQDGCNVKGYYYWTLMDNFEWAFGFDMRFGLYETDFSKKMLGLESGKTYPDDDFWAASAAASAGKGSLSRRLKYGAEYYRDLLKKFAKPVRK